MTMLDNAVSSTVHHAGGLDLWCDDRLQNPEK